MAKRRKSTRKQSKLTSFLIVVAVIVVCAVSIAKFRNLYNQSKDLSITEKSLENRIEETAKEREILENQENYMQTKQYVEDMAKEKLGMVYPDEIVIRPKN